METVKDTFVYSNTNIQDLVDFAKENQHVEGSSLHFGVVVDDDNNLHMGVFLINDEDNRIKDACLRHHDDLDDDRCAAPVQILPLEHNVLESIDRLRSIVITRLTMPADNGDFYNEVEVDFQAEPSLH